MCFDALNASICVAISWLVELDGLDAANDFGVASERRPGLGSFDPVVGLRRTCHQTTLWVVGFVLEAPETGRSGPC